LFSGIVIPENQKFTIVREDQNYDEGEPFYYEDSNLESPYRVIVFTTARNLALMEKHNNWYGDGTFNVAPKLMTQLYTIQIIIRQKCLPMVYAYLPNKKYLTYLTLFQLIHKNISNYPKSISLDFEKAVFKAVTEVFPSIMIHGCFFHLSQNFLKHVKKYDCLTFYYSCEIFRQTLTCARLWPFYLLKMLLKVSK
jgi:hypothetical protein